MSSSLGSSTSSNNSDRSKRRTLLAIVLITSVCGLLYKMVIGTITSDQMSGGSTLYSFVIGLYLFAMGVGATLSRRVHGDEVALLVRAEVVVGLLGGSSGALLVMAHNLLNAQCIPFMVVITLIVGTGVGLEVPLLTRLAASQGGLEKALADVLSFDYLGALIASFLFPFILLPSLGIVQAAIVVGLFNIGAAMLATFMACAHRWRLRFLLSAATIALVGGLILASPPISAAVLTHTMSAGTTHDAQPMQMTDGSR